MEVEFRSGLYRYAGIPASVFQELLASPSVGKAINAILMKWETQNEIFCALLADRLRDQLFEMMKKVREEAYDQGWRDAKSKKGAKETWFSGLQP